MRLLLAVFLLLSTPVYACQQEHICNDFIVCDEKSTTMTRAQFNAWLLTDASKNGYTIEWASSSNAWVVYSENCRLQEKCFDSTGVCVNG